MTPRALLPLLLALAACTGETVIADPPAADAASADLGAGAADLSGPAPDLTAAAAPPLFDLPRIRDRREADCRFERERPVVRDGVALTVWDVSYSSLEVIDGAPRPIRLRAFAARPAAPAGPLAGVVQAHGLGGFAEEAGATGPAALLSAFVLAYTGPGGGSAPANSSEGRPAGYMNGRRLFDTVPDVRGSWFWAHTVAALRALTCLEGRPEVDAGRLGLTGYSAGGVATLLGAGADDRVKAAVPVSGALAWSAAVASPAAWQHALLKQAGLDTSSAEWQRLQRGLIDPMTALSATRTPTLMVNGTTDEFFPLTAHRATLDALPAASRRTALIGNFDHGCYKVSGIEGAAAIEERAKIRSEGGARLWFGHHLGTDRRFATLPRAPEVQLSAAGAATLIAATVDAAGYQIEDVKLWWSNDDAFVFGAVSLDRAGEGRYGKLAAFPLGPATVHYVDVQYRTRDLLFPVRFSLSSPPVVPAAPAPHIRSIETCL